MSHELFALLLWLAPVAVALVMTRQPHPLDDEASDIYTTPPEETPRLT